MQVTQTKNLSDLSKVTHRSLIHPDWHKYMDPAFIPKGISGTKLFESGNVFKPFEIPPSSVKLIVFGDKPYFGKDFSGNAFGIDIPEEVETYHLTSSLLTLKKAIFAAQNNISHPYGYTFGDHHDFRFAFIDPSLDMYKDDGIIFINTDLFNSTDASRRQFVYSCITNLLEDYPEIIGLTLNSLGATPLNKIFEQYNSSYYSVTDVSYESSISHLTSHIKTIIKELKLKYGKNYSSAFFSQTPF